MNLLINIMQSISGAIITPPMIFILLVLAVILYLKNKRITGMQRLILGDSVNSIVELTLSQIVLGVLAGILGSVILSSMGVVFSSNSGIAYLFVTSVLLMLINPRFICFSYSGAVLGALSILSRVVYSDDVAKVADFANINIMDLIIFVGVMHIIEGILVMIDGDRGAIPVFTNVENKILGGYALRRYWVMPISLMLMMNSTTLNSYSLEFSSMPDWWPLINSPYILEIIGTAASTIALVPFFAMTGYSSITFTRSKRRKAVISGMSILVYGIIMTIVSQIALIGVIGEIILIIFMPFAHETMLKLQRLNEEKRNPIFISDMDGLTILEIVPGTEFDNQGIKCGDKILSVNNERIKSEADIYTILKKSLYQITVNIITKKGAFKTITLKHNKRRRLGMLLVPCSVENEDVIEVNHKSFKSILENIKEKEMDDRDLDNNSHKNKK